VSSQPVTHATYVIERQYPTTPARAFGAFADPAQKRRWFTGSRQLAGSGFEMDFRVGGHELTRSVIEEGPFKGTQLTNDTVYQDIVPNERIVFAYTMSLGDRRISASLVTVEFRAAGAHTTLVFTDQGAYFERSDGAERRKHGWGKLLDRLGRELSA